MKRFTYSILLLLFLMPIFASASYLKISDPQRNWSKQNGTVEAIEIIAEPMENYMKYEVIMTISDKGTSFYGNATQLEIDMHFSLPEGSIVNDSWLWVDGEPIIADLIDKWTASLIYEGIVKRRRDPSILTKLNDYNYNIKIYPLMVKNSRKIKIQYITPVAQIGNGISSVQLPNNFAKHSRHIPNLYKLYFKDSDDFHSPQIGGIDTKFNKETNYYGEYLVQDLKDKYNLLKSDKNLVYQNKTISENIAFNTYVDKKSTEKDKYYKISVNAAKLVTTVNSKNILILYDYQEGRSSHSKNEILQYIQNSAIGTLGNHDKFNIITSNYTMKTISDDWMPATDSDIKSAFLKFDKSYISNYSNLHSLLFKGADFVKLHPNTSSIVLVSNSAEHGNIKPANLLITELLEKLGTKVPLFIADVRNLQATRYYHNKKYYYGNEYLYNMITARTGGELFNTITSPDPQQIITTGMANSIGNLNNLNSFIQPTNGLCFDRYKLSNSNNNSNGSFTEIGKYVGDFPITVHINGFYRGFPFAKQYTVEKGTTTEADSILKTLWVGSKLRTLENTNPKTNKLNMQIVNLSMDNRILSRLTAFLAIEPNMNLDSLKGELDDNGNTGAINDKNSNDKSTYVNIYPNPVKDNSTISIDLSNIANKENLTLSVYNTVGTKVKAFTVDGFSSAKSFQWDGTDNSGQKLAKGMYILVLDNGIEKFRFKFIVL